MESCARTELYDILASRKAEEAAWRRFQATEWLQSIVGPLRISSNPSEKEFISLLRNGLILCNAINKIHPGAVAKVVENPSPMLSFTRESQPLPAYQYFENVRNFLVAAEELKLPAFEASDLERDALDAGSVAKVVDCVLALKSYHDCKHTNGGNEFFKNLRSPIVMHSSNGNNSRPVSSSSCRQLDMSQVSERKASNENTEAKELEDFHLLVKMLACNVVDAKENINDNLLKSFRAGNTDPMALFGRLLSSCLDINKFPELKAMCGDSLKECSRSPAHSLPLQDFSEHGASKRSKADRVKENGNHQHLLRMQEKELHDIKTLLRTTKKEFSDMQFKLERDMRELTIQVQEMSSAAFGYHRVLEENRNLFNMVQDLKGNIRVYCRIRPAFSSEIRNVIDFIGKDGSLVLSDPLKPQKDGRKMFQFNQIFGPASTQEEVFMDIQPLIRSVMDGYNVCIFAYGQTGSGKTYTMSGPPGGLSKDMGINYLALNDLFHISSTRKDVVAYDIHVQMVEIYNEQVRDLLAQDPSANKLEIRSCTSDMSLPDATLHSVKSTADVLHLMKLGEVNRVVCSTAINNRSSRSHSIMTVHVHGKDVSGNMQRSCLHLVDLAGSERVDKSEVTGDSLKEAQYINKSLSCLGDVIAALSQRNSYIPYRNSKLTLLLQDSLGGHAKTLMFAHVSPEGDSFGETISTLKFAQRVATVELGAARANKESSEIMHLKEQVENLRKALANKEAMSERTPPRVRRLSIENGSHKETQNPQSSRVKEAMSERTPPRVRRLSIENGSHKETQNAQSSRVKEPRSPSEKPRAKIDRTPPHQRRLGIENGSNVKSEKKMNAEDRKGLKTPSTATRSRRLSLEGPRSVKKGTLQPNLADNKFDTVVTTQKYGLPQDPEALIKPYGNYANSNTMEVYHINAPVSPTGLVYQRRMAKADDRSRIPTLQLSTPNPLLFSRNVQNELTQPTDSRIANALDNSNGKGSQIRKSLRTIGKLINGSEKRSAAKEPRSPIKGSNTNNAIKSPITAHARMQRRRSLTGGQMADSDRSRRSSLGGNSVETDDSRRNARTPPPVHYSATKAIKR